MGFVRKTLDSFAKGEITEDEATLRFLNHDFSWDPQLYGDEYEKYTGPFLLSSYAALRVAYLNGIITLQQYAAFSEAGHAPGTKQRSTIVSREFQPERIELPDLQFSEDDEGTMCGYIPQSEHNLEGWSFEIIDRYGKHLTDFTEDVAWKRPDGAWNLKGEGSRRKVWLTVAERRHSLSGALINTNGKRFPLWNLSAG